MKVDKKGRRDLFNRPKKNVKLRKMYVMFNPEVKVRSTNLNVCQQVTTFKLETHRIRHIETQEPITDWDDLKEDQLVFAYFDNQEFENFGGQNDPDRVDPFMRAKIIILEDHFEISKEDYDNDNIYIQWRCDPHQPCSDIRNDPGYCPTGCSFAPLSNISKLKFGIKLNNNAIRCCTHDETECSHKVTSDDFYKLQLHQTIVALWPFTGNHFYQGRIVKMVRVNSFPERKSLETVRVNETPKKHSSNEKYIAFDETYGSVYVN